MNFHIRKVAVLGAGVMGAQIAAHLANADVPVVLFDLAAKEGNPNGIVQRALDGLTKLSPTPWGIRDRRSYIDAANYDQHLEQLQGCDFIIEAIAEKMEWKDDIYRKIAPHVAPHAIIASNTSGLSINRLASALPADLRPRFCGIHFFNPPRYMHLVELISTNQTDPQLLDNLESWLFTRLGKGIVRAKDTTNFVANRVGVFSMIAVMHHTDRLGLGFDAVDALTGPKIGRPKSATYRTMDVVGLDTLEHVIKTMQDTLPDDPWHCHYAAPVWLKSLIERGALGQKTKGGIFRKQGKEIQVFDPAGQDYRAGIGDVAEEVDLILKIKNPAEKFAALRASKHPQAQLLWSIFRDVFHYCAFHLGEIADNARDVDFAMRWGFGWVQGPFETWQAAGWRPIAEAVRADIEAGWTMSSAALPAWVFEGSVADEGVHAASGSYSAAEKKLKGRSTLPVYRRQLYPQRVLSESIDAGKTLWENPGVRLWRLPQIAADIAILSFTTKMHAIGRDVLVGIREAVKRVEAEYAALVIWHAAPFGAGANLQEIADLIADNRFDDLDRFIKDFQGTIRAVKHAQVPVVAAMQGLALGGACELAMQCSHRVAAFETNAGLVEASVGLIPAGGGCVTLAIEAAQIGARQQYGEPNAAAYAFFQNVSMAKTSGSALEARSMGFLRQADDVVFNADELLYVALARARSLAEAGHRPPLAARAIPVAGRGGIATLEHQMVNMKEGGFISAHDYRVGKAVATALCGGNIEGGTTVSEQWLYDVERQEFLALLKTPETQARILHMLKTGKPLRN